MIYLKNCIAEWYSAPRNTIPGYRRPGIPFRGTGAPEYHSGVQGIAAVKLFNYRYSIARPECR